MTHVHMAWLGNWVAGRVGRRASSAVLRTTMVQPLRLAVFHRHAVPLVVHVLFVLGSTCRTAGRKEKNCTSISFFLSHSRFLPSLLSDSTSFRKTTPHPAAPLPSPPFTSRRASRVSCRKAGSKQQQEFGGRAVAARVEIGRMRSFDGGLDFWRMAAFGAF